MKDGIEAGARRIRRSGQIQTALMTALLVGGMMAIGAAPRIDLLKLLGKKKRNPYRLKHQLNDTLRRLVLKGYVTFVDKDGRKFARLTPNGERYLQYEQQKAALQLQGKKRWDKRWRVVIFDIPEYRRGTRDKLRLTMQNTGFYRLQDSVWLYPHDCEDFIALLKADLKIGNAILYMVVEKIENDTKIKTHFSLS
jgi:CRISPR-associated endonuclease Cas2